MINVNTKSYPVHSYNYLNKPYHGLRFLKCSVKIQDRRLYSPSLKDVALLEVAQLIFVNFPYICL